jgi:mevalonate pyrophosphate decarboxylase
MDAGANVKLIFRDGDTNDVLQVFPNAQVIDPFDGSGQN